MRYTAYDKLSALILSLLLMAGSANSGEDDRVYVFAFSNDGPPANYIESGSLIGQSVDMVLKICEVAGKTCETAVVPRRHCWDSSTFPALSPALDGRWFDVCANYPLSAPRVLNYGFPHQPFFKTPDPTLVIRPGSNITMEGLQICNDFRLAYPGNTAVTPQCAYASSLWIDPSLLVNVPAESDLIDVNDRIVDAVLNNQADIGLVITRYLLRDDIEVLATLPCSTQLALTLNIMTRKDDTTLLQWWDEAVLDYFCNNTDEYLEFCQDLQQTYGKYSVDPFCRIPDVDLNCSDPNAATGGLSDEIPVRIAPCPETTTERDTTTTTEQDTTTEEETTTEPDSTSEQETTTEDKTTTYLDTTKRTKTTTNQATSTTEQTVIKPDTTTTEQETTTTEQETTTTEQETTTTDQEPTTTTKHDHMFFPITIHGWWNWWTEQI